MDARRFAPILLNLRHFSVVSVLILTAVVDSHNFESLGSETIEQATWTQCRTFIAPSLTPEFGLGVFAARKFMPGEYIEFSPMYLHAADNSLKVQLSSTALATYHISVKGLGYMVPFGSAMVFNSHPSPNAKVDGGGKFPSKDARDSSLISAVKAIETILPGEEIFIDYGSSWFQRVNFQQKETRSSSTTRAETLQEDLEKYCSKLVAGVGHSMLQRLSGHVRTDLIRQLMHQVPPVDRGLGMVTARFTLRPGELIELVPALLLPVSKFVGSILAPLLVEWFHLSTSNRRLLLDSRKQKRVVLQTFRDKGDPTTMHRKDIWNVSNLALLPLGSVALIERAGENLASANCELVIQDSAQSRGEQTAVDVALVAIKQVEEGQVLVLNLPKSGDAGETLSLMMHMLTTGQPLPAMLTGLPRFRNSIEQLGTDRTQGKRRHSATRAHEL